MLIGWCLGSPSPSRLISFVRCLCESLLALVRLVCFDSPYAMCLIGFSGVSCNCYFYSPTTKHCQQQNALLQKSLVTGPKVSCQAETACNTLATLAPGQHKPGHRSADDMVYKVTMGVVTLVPSNLGMIAVGMPWTRPKRQHRSTRCTLP